MRKWLDDHWPVVAGLGLCMASSAFVSAGVSLGVLALASGSCPEARIERHKTFDRRPSAGHRPDWPLEFILGGPIDGDGLTWPEPPLGPIAGSIPSAVDPIEEVKTP